MILTTRTVRHTRATPHRLKSERNPIASTRMDAPFLLVVMNLAGNLLYGEIAGYQERCKQEAALTMQNAYGNVVAHCIIIPPECYTEMDNKDIYFHDGIEYTGTQVTCGDRPN